MPTPAPSSQSLFPPCPRRNSAPLPFDKKQAEASAERNADYYITTDENAERQTRNKKKHLIYIAEDDDEIRNYLCDELSKHYSVKAFHNGKEALEGTCKENPDLVISDVMMPEMDGYALTEAIKGNVHLNTIPVILLTARSQDEDKIKGLEADADAYVAKPFDINVLMAQIKVLLKNYSRLRNAFNGNQAQERHVEKIEVESNDDKLMSRFMSVINKNISDSELTVEAIADEVGISRVHMYRKIKDLTNQTPRDFLRNYRLQRAAELLADHKLNISQICDEVGFANASSFSTAFKKLYGTSPPNMPPHTTATVLNTSAHHRRISEISDMMTCIHLVSPDGYMSFSIAAEPGAHTHARSEAD